jgi:hypothetical protein
MKLFKLFVFCDEDEIGEFGVFHLPLAVAVVVVLAVEVAVVLY